MSVAGLPDRTAPKATRVPSGDKTGETDDEPGGPRRRRAFPRARSWIHSPCITPSASRIYRASARSFCVNERLVISAGPPIVCNSLPDRSTRAIWRLWESSSTRQKCQHTVPHRRGHLRGRVAPGRVRRDRHGIANDVERRGVERLAHQRAVAKEENGSVALSRLEAWCTRRWTDRRARAGRPGCQATRRRVRAWTGRHE